MNAEFVWEHPYYPVFYIPLRDIQNGPAEISNHEESNFGYWNATVTLGDYQFEVAGFHSGPLEDLVKVPVESIDAWYAEDEKLLGPHPKDPYKRIECLPSSREVRIDVDGTVVARSSNNIFLHETSLRTRYYLSSTSIRDWSMLVKSDTSTFCPYKGKANYYDLLVGGNVIKDAVWYYTYPTAESAAIQNRLCFYNEKVAVYVDGVKEQK